LLEQLAKCNDSLVPSLDDHSLCLYAMRKDWGSIGSGIEDRLIRQDYDKWEREYLDRSVCHCDIKKNQKDYMFFCNNFDLKELIDLKPAQGSVYIKSVCEPFDAEMSIDWKRIENWVNHFGMSLNKTHVSGHASGPQLKDFVDVTKPGLIIPIHTQHPEFYEKWHKNVRLLKGVGEKVEI
jgi:ribonuclease J